MFKNLYYIISNLIYNDYELRKLYLRRYGINDKFRKEIKSVRSGLNGDVYKAS